MSTLTEIQKRKDELNIDIERQANKRAELEQSIQNAKQALKDAQDELTEHDKSAKIPEDKLSELTLIEIGLNKDEEERVEKLKAQTLLAQQYLAGVDSSEESERFMNLMIAFDIDITDPALETTESDYHDSTPAPET